MTSPTEVIVEMVSFAWEVINLCTFICEEACQAAMMGAASALNKGNVGLADQIVEKGLKEAVSRLAIWATLTNAFLIPSGVMFSIYAIAVVNYIAEAEEVIESVRVFPGRIYYPGLTRYGRFF